MTIEEFMEIGRVRSKMKSYQAKKEKAIECCAGVLEQSSAPYAALSGGKDSVAMCFLLDEAARKTGKGYRIWAHVSDASFPGTAETIKETAQRVGRPLDLDVSEQSAFEALKNEERAAFGKTGVFFDAVRKYAKEKDAVFVGVRASESRRRARAAKTHGQVFESRSMGRVTVCHPLLWFQVYDVAAVLSEYGAPIHPIYYKTQIEVGKNSEGEERFIRLSYITSRDLLNKGTAVFLKYNYPAEYAKLCEAWPEIRRYV